MPQVLPNFSYTTSGISHFAKPLNFFFTSSPPPLPSYFVFVCAACTAQVQRSEGRGTEVRGQSLEIVSLLPPRVLAIELTL